jgi:hypothetical protein
MDGPTYQFVVLCAKQHPFVQRPFAFVEKENDVFPDVSCLRSNPRDITLGSPDPTGWGLPFAYFALGSNCTPDHFQNATVIINLTFCGDYAGGVWADDPVCSAQGSCVDFVRDNPSVRQPS